MRTDWMEGRTDRQTDMTKLIVAFRNSTNASTDVGYNHYSNKFLEIHNFFSKTLPFGNLIFKEIQCSLQYFSMQCSIYTFESSVNL